MPIITINGTEHEVELDAIQFSEDETSQVAETLGFVTQAQHEATIKSRVGRAERSARKALMNDEEFARELFEARGIELREDGTVKGSLKDQKALEERWAAQKLSPVQTQLDEAMKTIGELRQSQLQAEILRYADGVKPTLRDAFLREASSRLSLDEETGKWGVRDGEAFRFTSDGKLMGAEHVIEEMRSSQPDWFQSDKMTGSGFQKAGTAGKRTFTPEQIASMSEAEYEANRSAILGIEG